MSIEHSPARQDTGGASPTPARQTLTIAEAANILGIGRNQAYQAARAGQIPNIKIGKRIIVPRIAFERMLRGEAV